MISKTQITKRVYTSIPLERVQFFAIKTPIKNAVTIKGSILGGRNFSPANNPLIADLTALMLDEGTTKHSKEEIHTQLESIGATIMFTCTGDRVRFEVRCLKQHVARVIELLAEQLRYPALEARRLSIIKQHVHGELLSSNEDTRYRAEGAFLRLLYPKHHPHYRISVDEALKQLDRITRADLKTFHKNSYGLGSLIITAAGDVSIKILENAIRTSFYTWKIPVLARTAYKKTAKPPRTSVTQQHVFVPDKTSVDIYLGHAVTLTKGHSDFYPLYIAMEILGGRGGFTGRLMKHIREIKGLTYGVYSSIAGTEDGNKGYWFIWGTFAPSLLQEGRTEINKQLKHFIQKGVTVKEVTIQKQRAIGAYTVRLSNTVGLSQTLLTNAEEGKPKEYIDIYRDVITTVTTHDVNAVIKKYMRPNQLVFVAAGSV